MRERPAFAVVRLVLLCVLFAALVGCGSDKVVNPAGPGKTPMPPPTPPTLFTLTGFVSTATGQSLPGATVRATWASGSASTVSVGNLGSAYGLQVPTSGDVTVHAEMDGYDAQERTLTMNGSARLDFALARTLPTDQYRLSVTASPSCSLPSEAASRQYTAGLSVDPSGRATVYLRGGTMLAFMGEAGFTGVREGDTLRLQVSDDDFAPYAFVEFLDGYRWLSYSGTVTGRIAGNRIDATFDGRIRLVQYPAEMTVAECTAADHRMEFVR